MADSEMCLNAARAVYPNDEDLRVAYMLGFNDGYERRESEQPPLPDGLEEAAIDFADNARKQLFTKDYAISSIADYDHGCIDGFIAGAKWQKAKMLEKAVEFECIGKKVKMTIQELINYYIDQECCDVADECGF